MAVTSKPNSVTDKLVAGQVEVKPRVSGDILIEAAVKSGKLGGQQAKRKKADEDDLLRRERPPQPTQQQPAHLHLRQELQELKPVRQQVLAQRQEQQRAPLPCRAACWR